jgi:nitrogen regulatory protein P-II 1
MKKIEAIVHPCKVRDIRLALRELGAGGVTVTQVLGHGRDEEHTEVYRGLEYDASLRPRAKLEVVVGDRDLDDVIDVIYRAAHTGDSGDGKIFVSDVAEVIRISSAERDEAAV